MVLDVTSNADAHFSTESSCGWPLALTDTHWKLLYGSVGLVPCRTHATAAVTLNWP